MHYRTPRIVQPGSGRPLLWILLVVLGLFAAGGYLWLQAWQEGRPDPERLQARIAADSARIQALEKERGQLLEQVAMLEQTSQIDRAAVQQVREQLAAFQQERSKMEEELTFLRSMVSTREDREAIRVQRLVIEKGGAEGRYRYRFTITRSMQNGGTASGWVFFAVDGTRGGKPAWLPLREITEEGTEKLKMKFRNFQDIEGEIQLPDDFKPLKVIIEVKPSDRKLPPVKQRFDWKVTG